MERSEIRDGLTRISLRSIRATRLRIPLFKAPLQTRRAALAGGPSIVEPRSGERTVTRDVTRPGPRKRQQSSSRHPVNAAMDNEPQDHLLSVVHDQPKH